MEGRKGKWSTKRGLVRGMGRKEKRKGWIKIEGDELHNQAKRSNGGKINRIRLQPCY